MKLFLVRHGETDWNVNNQILGRTDIPLNDRGREQAGQLAEKMKQIPLDIIYTSPLSRTLVTGQIVADKQKDCKCVPEECLIEQDFGIFEGIDRGDRIYQEAKRKYFCRYPDGESYLDVAGRVYPFLEYLQSKADQYQNVLIVTHGGICRVITSYFQDMTNEEFASFTMKNCEEIREFEI